MSTDLSTDRDPEAGAEDKVEGEKLPGVGIFDMHTRPRRPDEPRLIGNVLARVRPLEGEADVTPQEAVQIARAFRDAGADIIDVSAGQTTTEAKPVYGRMFQTPLSDRIRNEGGLATII